jgi:hypothetical protein
MGLKTRPQPSHTLHGFRVVVEISSTYHSLLTQSTPLAHFVILPISLFLHMLYLLCKTTVVLYIVADKLERGNKVVGTPKSHHITQALAHRISPFPFHPITPLSPYTLHLVNQSTSIPISTSSKGTIDTYLPQISTSSILQTANCKLQTMEDLESHFKHLQTLAGGYSINFTES